MSDPKHPAASSGPQRPDVLSDTAVRRLKFGTASEGWEAYNTWLERMRQQPGRVSRQAVIAKALYSVTSYKNWADKARGAFDDKK